MKTRTIVFDIDGVLADFSRGFTEWAKQHINGFTPVTPSHMHEEWSVFPGMTPDEVTKTWAHIARNPVFWTSIPPIATTEEFFKIDRLRNAGHLVYFATNRRLPSAFVRTNDWLIERGIVDASIVITHRKGEFCKVVDADYYIDDKPENVDCAIWLTDGKTKAYVRDHPYNRGKFAPHSSKAKRASSISEFLKEIK